MFPCFVGGECEDGSEKACEGGEGVVDYGLGGAAAGAVGGVAVEAVFCGIDVDGGEVCGAELV